VLGFLTWLVARYAVSISGASREMTEGFTALLAAGMLLYVGYWLHNRSNTKAWQRFIRDKVDAALGRRTLWALAGISFLAVYRELFEIILFYETLLSQAGPTGQHAVLGGIGAALVLLALIGGAILKFSVRLPIGPFFASTAGLLALMAVVFAGNGAAALQEAGVMHATMVRFISVPLLGIHATAQGLVMQGIVLALVIAGVLVGRWRVRTAAVR
jgi:high-affinity iron transporter